MVDFSLFCVKLITHWNYSNDYNGLEGHECLVI